MRIYLEAKFFEETQNLKMALRALLALAPESLITEYVEWNGSRLNASLSSDGTGSEVSRRLMPRNGCRWNESVGDGWAAA